MPASGHPTWAVFTALSSRRIWSLEEKRAILAEMAVPGAVVMEVARRHGIAQSLLYRWRSDAAAAAAKAVPVFLPVTIEGPPAATPRKMATKPRLPVAVGIDHRDRSQQWPQGARDNRYRSLGTRADRDGS